MNKRELMAALADYPDEMEVFFDGESVDPDFRLSHVDGVEIKNAKFVDNAGELEAEDTVIVLTSL